MTTPENSNNAINQTDELRDAIAEILTRDSKMSASAIAREAGFSPSAFSSWRSGSYAGDNSSIESKLLNWLEGYRQRRHQAKALPSAPGFQPTPTARRITATLSYAQYAEDIVVVYGGAGVGKTETIEQYQVDNPNVWIATMSPATKTTVPALEEVAIALGIREAGGGAAKIQREIIRKMRKTHGLLIIDEAQHLGVDALDAMRALYDATKVGLALVGNETVYASMTGGNRAAYLDRLYSRIGKKLKVTKASSDDVDVMISAWGFKDKKCIEIAREIASKPGGLRVLTKTLRIATMFAAGASRDICCDDIRAAWRDLSDATV